MADGFSHRNVTLGIELYLDDVERRPPITGGPDGLAGGRRWSPRVAWAWPPVSRGIVMAGGSARPGFGGVSGPRSRPCRCDDHVFDEIRLTGTQHADWAGIPATGRSINTRVGCLYEFDDDQLVC
jgi:hypothetical protein